MSQITSGIRNILEHPLVYKLLLSLVGADRTRRECTEKYFRPTPGMKILDIGCGSAELFPYLPDSIEYYGIDLSQKYIDYAKNKFGEKGTFICGDINEKTFELKHKFDLVIGYGLLHHLDDNEVIRLFKTVTSILKPNGRVVTFDPCYTENNTMLVKFLMGCDRGQNIRSGKNYQKLAEHAFENITLHVRDDISRVPHATAAILECAGNKVN